MRNSHFWVHRHSADKMFCEDVGVLMNRTPTVIVALSLCLIGLLSLSACKSNKPGLGAEERQSAEMERARAEAEARNRMMQPQIEWVAANLNTHRFDSETYTNGIRQTKHETVSATVDNPCSLRVIEQIDSALSTPGWDMSFKSECSINLRSLSGSGITLERDTTESRVALKDDAAVDCLQTMKGQPPERHNKLTLFFANSRDAEQFLAGFKKMVRENCSPKLADSVPSQEEQNAKQLLKKAAAEADNPKQPVYCQDSNLLNDGRKLLMAAVPNKGHLGVFLVASYDTPDKGDKIFEGDFTKDENGVWTSHFAPPHQNDVSGVLFLREGGYNLKLNVPTRDGSGTTERYLGGSCQ